MIARDLRVSVRSVQRWRRMWDEGGPRAGRGRAAGSRESRYNLELLVLVT
ncbi:helix-turn-helix domain-containing protein (plasmid) [Streptomyces cavourensis]